MERPNPTDLDAIDRFSPEEYRAWLDSLSDEDALARGWALIAEFRRFRLEVQADYAID